MHEECWKRREKEGGKYTDCLPVNTFDTFDDVKSENVLLCTLKSNLHPLILLGNKHLFYA